MILFKCSISKQAQVCSTMFKFERLFLFKHECYYKLIFKQNQVQNINYNFNLKNLLIFVFN